MHSWWLLILSAALTVLLFLVVIICNLRVAMCRMRAQARRRELSGQPAPSRTLQVVRGSGAVMQLVAMPPPEPAHRCVPVLTVRDALPAGGEPADTRGEEACPVCLDPLAGQKVACGPCGHWMHEACVRKWLMKDKASLCPVCRASLTVKVPTAKASDTVEHAGETVSSSPNDP